MRAQGWGRVISVSSIGGRRVVPDYAMIGASKAALEALTRYLAVELAAEGIVVNCVSPGLVATGALDAFPRRDAMLDHARRNTPAGRLITPEDVGALVAWLCSDAATMIVGQTIEIDGGYSLGMLHE
jgi:enoyl-[acyl-carrier protein] reductase III